MPLSTQCGTGEGLAGEAFLGGGIKLLALSSFCSNKGTFPYCFACLQVSVLWRHKGAAAHSADSIQPSPRQADGFIHGNPTWRLFCALKDSVGTGIQKLIHSLFALKWESRAGLSSLGYSPKTYPSCKLHTRYLHPIQPLLSPSLELCCPCPGRKPSRFSWEGTGSAHQGQYPRLTCTLCALNQLPE